MRCGKVIIGVVLLLGWISVNAAWCADAPTLPKKIPVTVTADKLDYDRTNDVYLAVGNVKVEQEGIRLEADRVVLNNKTGEAAAEGKVYLQDQGQVVRAEKLKINLSTKDGVITQGDIFLKKENFHMKGDMIERRSETVYHIENGVFTTCDDDAWDIKAREMNIDMERYATGNGVSFNMAGVPVMYAPYFLFPVRRQTGFLIPEVGRSSRDGVFTGVPFFWAISDSKDMTITSDYRERVGHGTGVEYRYMNSRESSGQLYYKFWDIYHTGVSRWDFRLKHQEEFAEDLSGRVDINLVSDEHYFYDLDKKLDARSKPYLDSNAFSVERWDTASLVLLGQYSYDLTRTNERTAQKLPELRYSIYEEPLAGPVHLNFEGSAVNFTKQEGQGVRRVDFDPSLSAVFGGNGLSFTPRVGGRATFYDRSADTVEPVQRKYVYAGADINARMSRIYGEDVEAGIGRIRHSIEPTLSYTLVPRVDQEHIPRFDSVDSVAEQNRVSLALINRLTARYKEAKDSPKTTTFDLMVFRLSQSYKMNVEQDPTTGSTRPRSLVLGELFFKTPKLFSMTSNGQYDTYSHRMSSHSVGASLTTDQVQLNVTHQYLRDPATQFLIGGGVFKLKKWELETQWWRDIENKKTTQEEYRIHYASQCWGMSVAYTVKPGETQFKVMMDLKGLGGK